MVRAATPRVAARDAAVRSLRAEEITDPNRVRSHCVIRTVRADDAYRIRTCIPLPETVAQLRTFFRRLALDLFGCEFGDLEKATASAGHFKQAFVIERPNVIRRITAANRTGDIENLHLRFLCEEWLDRRAGGLIGGHRSAAAWTRRRGIRVGSNNKSFKPGVAPTRATSLAHDGAVARVHTSRHE